MIKKATVITLILTALIGLICYLLCYFADNIWVNRLIIGYFCVVGCSRLMYLIRNWLLTTDDDFIIFKPKTTYKHCKR